MRKTLFSIRSLMLLVALAGLLAWLYQAVNPFAFVVVIVYSTVVAGLAVGPWFVAREDRRRAGWILAISSALEFAILAYLGVFTLRYLAGVYKFLIALVLLPPTIGAGVAWAQLASAPGAPRRVVRPLAWATVGFLVLLPASMMATHWPLWVAFRLSRPALERLVDRVASGETMARPEWAGWFRVKQVSSVDVGRGNTALVVENDSTGHTWLIRTASPEAVPAVGPGAPFNHRLVIENYRLIPGDRWWHYESD